MKDMERCSIDIGVDGHAPDAQFAARTHDAKRNLAAVGDQNFSDANHVGAFYGLNNGRLADLQLRCGKQKKSLRCGGSSE
jgi:hypothetical protein